MDFVHLTDLLSLKQEIFQIYKIITFFNLIYFVIFCIIYTKSKNCFLDYNYEHRGLYLKVRHRKNIIYNYSSYSFVIIPKLPNLNLEKLHLY